MTQQLAIDEPAPYGRFTDAFVILSVTVLSLALGAWFLTRLNLTLWWGMVAAMTAYAILLAVHLLVRRSLAGDEAGLDEHEVDWMSSSLTEHEEQGEAADYAPERLSLSPDVEAANWRTGSQHAPAEQPAADAPSPFSFRPSRVSARSESAGPSLTEAPQRPGASGQEMSVEVIQDLIKKLADELNGSTPAAANPANSVEQEHGAQSSMRASPSQATGGAAGASRGQRAPFRLQDPPFGTPNASRGSAPTPPALDPQLARIAEAVAAERIDVLLEPIHALAEGRPRHFEVSIRLLTADGAALEQSEFAPLAIGSGLMPRIDAQRMIRAARVARRLSERGREGSLLAAVTGESLTDEMFLKTARLGSGDGIRLVLSFAQSEVRAFSPGHHGALATMASAGFRFALEAVTDLDMDFGALKAMGFEFVELDAPVFLDGLPAASGRIPASDICRYLADFGLALIVGRIEDDWLLARILGFGVLFGKGALFGGPKLVKPEVVAETADA